MPERELTCPYCNSKFVAWHTSKYCSLKCAVDSRILVLADDQCWPWIGGVFKKDHYGRLTFNGTVSDAHNAAYRVHVGEIPKGMLVRHTCDNPICCNYKSHLLIGTVRENSSDAVERNLVCHGERHPASKLTVDTVIQLRKLFRLGDVSAAELARQYGCSDVAMQKLLTGRTWKRVPNPIVNLPKSFERNRATLGRFQ